MLLNDFFTINNFNNLDQKIETSITINSKHSIFEGHFPNNPVTPGVVQIQIIKELLEHTLTQKCTLKEVGRCKFMAVLNPETNPNILITINYSILDDSTIKVSAQGSSDNKEQTFFKFNAKFTS